MKFTRSITGMVLAVVLTFSSLTVTAFAAGDIMYGIGFVNTNALRMRSTPSTEGSVLDTAPQNDCVAVISKSGQWYKVNYNLQEGYMHEDYLDVLTCENAELGSAPMALPLR